LGGCAKSRHRTGTEDAADSAPAEIADSGIFIPDSDQEDAYEESDASDGSFYPHDSGDDFLGSDFPGFSPPPDPPEPPTEVQEAMETLDEPDFAQPLDELAKEHCGYVFKAESTIDWVSRFQYLADTTTDTVETRVFDNAGRLVAAEIEWDANADPSVPTLIKNTRRIQIDYDQNARPMLIRISPISDDQTIAPVGSVIKTEYESDGSSRSL